MGCVPSGINAAARAVEETLATPVTPPNTGRPAKEQGVQPAGESQRAEPQETKQPEETPKPENTTLVIDTTLPHEQEEQKVEDKTLVIDTHLAVSASASADNHSNRLAISPSNWLSSDCASAAASSRNDSVRVRSAGPHSARPFGSAVNSARFGAGDERPRFCGLNTPDETNAHTQN